MPLPWQRHELRGEEFLKTVQRRMERLGWHFPKTFEQPNLVERPDLIE
jgi:hypothetical protein